MALSHPLTEAKLDRYVAIPSVSTEGARGHDMGPHTQWQWGSTEYGPPLPLSMWGSVYLVCSCLFSESLITIPKASTKNPISFQ